MPAPRPRTGQRALALIACAAFGVAGATGVVLAQAETVFTPITVPTISGNAVEGEVLTETRARWSEPPAGYTLQWLRCDAKSKDCQSISKANGSTYRLTAADVGSTIRISESARDSAGAVTPDQSEPTAVVQGHGSGSHGAGNEQGGGSGQGGGGGQPNSPSHPSAAEIKRALARELAPSGKSSSLRALRRNGSLRMRFTLPVAGMLTVKWYLVVPVPKHGKAKKHKPTLLAEGHATLVASRETILKLLLTPQGRQLLKHAHKLRVEAKATFAVEASATVAAASVFALHG